jgi:hypothetical protein
MRRGPSRAILTSHHQRSTEADMIARHGSADRHGQIQSGSRADPTARRVTDRHFRAVVAAEIHRLALELRAAQRPVRT